MAVLCRPTVAVVVVVVVVVVCTGAYLLNCCPAGGGASTSEVVGQTHLPASVTFLVRTPTRGAHRSLR